jgi:hypothetical protein
VKQEIINMPKISVYNTLYNYTMANRNCEFIHDKFNALSIFTQVIRKYMRRRKWRRRRRRRKW